MLEAAGRVVMVSGASRGIGRAVVERLLASGFCVSAGVREPRGLKDGDRLLVRRYDAESVESAESFVAAALERFGKLDVLLNAAGINPSFGVEDADESVLDALWAVNVASLSGKRVPNPHAGYAMSKLRSLRCRTRCDGRGRRMACAPRRSAPASSRPT